MADAPQNYLFQLIGACDPIPTGFPILPSWDFLVFDPILSATYKATGQQIVDSLVPSTTFGLAAPVFPSIYPIGSVYFETPLDGGLRIWQLTSISWELKWDFAGGTVPITTSYTATKGYTATCESGYTGKEVYREATRKSTVSQADANALALAAATAAATAALVCTLTPISYTSTQSYTASCPSGSTGNAVTQVATATSSISQLEADKKALAAAKATALAGLVCTVTAVNAPPVVRLLSATPSPAAVGQPLTLTAGASDADGVAQVEFLDGNTSLGIRTSTPYTLTHTPTISGTHVYFVKATDTLGASATDSITVTITAAAPITYTSTKSFTATCGTGTTGPSVTRQATRTSTVSQADADNQALTEATNQATSSLVCTPGTVNPSFNKTFIPGENTSTVTFSAADGNRFKVNFPLSTNTDPNPATMLVFTSDGNQVGQVDYNGADTGTTCGYALTPDEGAKVYLLTFTNGNVTLS